MPNQRERESKNPSSQILTTPADIGTRGILKITLTSLIAALACTGVIYAATNIGSNISTGGTLDVSGNSIFTTASSTGIVKFGQINSDTGSINFGDENLYTTGNIGIGTSSPYARLSVVGEVVANYFTATSTTATSTFKTVSIQASSTNLFVVQDANSEDILHVDGTVPGTQSAIFQYTNPDASQGRETMSVVTNIDGAIPASGIVSIKNSRYKLLFGANASGGNSLVNITSFANTLLLQNDSNVTVGSIQGITNRPSTGTGSGNITMNSYSGFVTGASGSGGRQFNATDIYGVKVEDWDTNIWYNSS